MRKRSIATALAVAIMTFAVLGVGTHEARADLRWNTEAAVGAEKRFLTGRSAGIEDGGIGPRLELRAHLSLLPLVRLGAYTAQSFTPQEDTWRHLSSVGVHAKFTSPFPERPFRVYASLGAGFAGAYRKSTATFDGRGGRYLEIPFGLGAGYTFRKPWTLTFEVGGAVGVAFSGSLYDTGAPISAGRDGAAVNAQIGVNLDL